MVGKNIGGRVGKLEKEMEEVKAKLETLTEMENMIQCLTQGLSQVISALEETSRSVQSIQKTNPVNKNPCGKDSSNAVPLKKSLVEDGKAQEQKKLDAEGRGGLQGKVSNQRIILFQSKRDSGLNNPHSRKLKGKKEESRDEEVLRWRLMLDEPFIELPPYSDFGVKGKLMKLKGRIRYKEVVVLINSDATHNFISVKLVEQLRLLFTSTRSYIVIANDFASESDGVCMWVTLKMPGATVVQHFLPFELVDNVDIILGSEWLNTLEDAMLYYEDGLCRMRFLEGKNVIEWKTDLNL